MQNRTFAVLLAAALMLMGALAGAFMKSDAGEEAAQNALAEIHEEPHFLMPASGEIVGEYGAQYSEEYGQWTLAGDAILQTTEGGSVIAPADGTIGTVEAAPQGGSSVTLHCSEVEITLSPVYNVRVFAESKVSCGDMIGESGAQLFFSAEVDGKAIDPMSLIHQMAEEDKEKISLSSTDETGRQTDGVE